MHIVNGLLIFIFLFVSVIYIAGLIKPKQKAFMKRFGEDVNRKKISKAYMPIILVLFVAIVFTAPPTEGRIPQPESTKNTQTELEPKIEEKEVTEVQPVAFVEEMQSDASLPAGQTRVIREGTQGEKTLTFIEKYKGEELSQRTFKAETVTIQPVSRLVAIGTYVAPPSPPPTPTSAYYTNCSAARAAGAAPVHQGEPGYGSHLDRDSDGVGCE